MSTQQRLRAALRRAAPLLVLALLGVAAWQSGVTRVLAPEALMSSREAVTLWVAHHQALAMLVFVAGYVAVGALCVPGAGIMTIASGFLFGAPLGAALSVIAATAGGTILFLAARTGFGHVMRERAGSRLGRLRRGFHADASSYMLFLRLTPAFPFWLVNLASALLGVRLRTFIWTTLVGIIPASLALAYAGVGLESVVMAHQAAYDACMTSGGQSCIMRIRPMDLVTREFVLALAALALLALLPVLVRRWRGRNAAEQVKQELT